jgi:hypothetical protein
MRNYMLNYPLPQGLHSLMPKDTSSAIYLTKEGYYPVGINWSLRVFNGYWKSRKTASEAAVKLTVEESLQRLALFLSNLSYSIICNRGRCHIVNTFPMLNPRQMSLEDAVSLYNWGIFSVAKSRQDQLVTTYMKGRFRFPTLYVVNAFTSKIDNTPLTLQRSRKGIRGLKV